MRILFVSQMTPYLPCHDGFRVLPAHLLEQLARRHTLALVAARAAGETPGQRGWPARFCAEVTTVAAGRWRHPLTGGPAEGLAAMRAAVTRAIAEFRPDVLHLEGGMLAPLARLDGVPTILSVHDSRALRARDFRQLSRRPWSIAGRLLEERLEAAWERRWFPAADACVVLSEEDRAWLASQVSFPRVEVIPLGVDTIHHAFRRSGQAGRIVFTGNFSWPPNVEAAQRFATRILPRVRARAGDAEFVIAGADPAPAVRALARLRGVVVTGTVPDLRPSIWSAAVYASPLTAGFGVKNKVLEAMALGTPIVASTRSLSGLADVLPGQHLLGADGEDALVEGTLLLLREPMVANLIAQNARTLVEARYTWGSVARRYEALYERVGVAPQPVQEAAA